jgi:hypothetical protein
LPATKFTGYTTLFILDLVEITEVIPNAAIGTIHAV